MQVEIGSYLTPYSVGKQFHLVGIDLIPIGTVQYTASLQSQPHFPAHGFVWETKPLVGFNSQRCHFRRYHFAFCGEMLRFGILTHGERPNRSVSDLAWGTNPLKTREHSQKLKAGPTGTWPPKLQNLAKKSPVPRHSFPSNPSAPRWKQWRNC